MANKWAIQNGNWSDGSTWNDGVVPTADDDVWLNGKTVTSAVDITARNLSNDASDYSVAGGLLNLTAVNVRITSNLIGKGSSFIVVVTNVNLTIIGDITCDMTVNCYFIDSSSSNNKVITVIGNVYLYEGVLFAKSQSHRIELSIAGNIIQYGGKWAYAYYLPSTINGNIELYGGTFYLNNGSQNYDTSVLNGNFLIDTNDNVSIEMRGSTVYGTITLKSANQINATNAKFKSLIISEESTVTNLFIGIDGAIFNDFYNNADLASLCNIDIRQVAFTISGDFHFGEIAQMTNSTFSKVFKKITLLNNAKIFYKKEKYLLFAEEIETDDSNVQYIYEGEGQPTFQIIRYAQQLNYPTEQQVAQGVTYGMQNEYEGRLTLPPESTVLKDVEYGGDKVGTLEVIALSGATAQAEDIAVVNLTEQQLQRVGNCATVSTVQKCFEEFKE